MYINQRCAIHHRTKRNPEFILQVRQNKVIESFWVTSHILFILGNVLIEKITGYSSEWVEKYEYCLKNEIGLNWNKEVRDSFYNVTSQVPWLEVKCKIETLWFPRPFIEGLLVNEMEKSDVGKLDCLEISFWHIYGRKKI